MKGTIRQRSPGSWRLEVYLGRDSSGKRLRHMETVRGRKSEAQRRLREILPDLDQVLLLQWSVTRFVTGLRPG